MIHQSSQKWIPNVWRILSCHRHNCAAAVSVVGRKPRIRAGALQQMAPPHWIKLKTDTVRTKPPAVQD